MPLDKEESHYRFQKLLEAAVSLKFKVWILDLELPSLHKIFLFYKSLQNVQGLQKFGFTKVRVYESSGLQKFGFTKLKGLQ